jgi:hypothetical protein
MTSASDTRDEIVKSVVNAVVNELTKAYYKFPLTQHSLHEGYGVLLEEVDEAWDEIKANNHGDAKKELIQVAAMAIRAIVDTNMRELGWSK